MDNKEISGLLAVAAENILILNDKAEIGENFRKENQDLSRRLIAAALDVLDAKV